MDSTCTALVAAMLDLSSELAAIKAPASIVVYDPTDYARAGTLGYLRLFNSRRRVVFVGMNPGPDGMAQTGVPFGDVLSARRLLELAGVEIPRIHGPRHKIDKRKVHGFEHKTREPSGSRFWDGLVDLWGNLETFAADAFVCNYCPLAFFDRESAKNVVPEHLPLEYQAEIEHACDKHLKRVLQTLEPEHVIGVGVYAYKHALEVVRSLREVSNAEPKVSRVLHPSPSNPSANQGWFVQALAQLRDAQVWPMPKGSIK